MSIKLCVVLRIILCKHTELSECGNHKGQLSDMEKKSVRTCEGARLCFVRRHDENKAIGAKLS